MSKFSEFFSIKAISIKAIKKSAINRFQESLKQQKKESLNRLVAVVERKNIHQKYGVSWQTEILKQQSYEKMEKIKRTLFLLYYHAPQRLRQLNMSGLLTAYNLLALHKTLDVVKDDQYLCALLVNLVNHKGCINKKDFNALLRLREQPTKVLILYNFLPLLETVDFIDNFQHLCQASEEELRNTVRYLQTRQETLSCIDEQTEPASSISGFSVK